jgi:hypothetical protein
MLEEARLRDGFRCIRVSGAPSEAVRVFIRFLYSSRYGCYLLIHIDSSLLIRIDSSLSSNSLKIRFQPKQFTVTEADEDSADSSSSSDF